MNTNSVNQANSGTIENQILSIPADILKRTSKYTGIFYLTAMVASLAGAGIFQSITSASNYFVTAADNQFILLTGVLLELINGIAVIGIAASMFPILRRQNEGMALGYLCLRVIEALFCCYIVIAPLSILKLSQGLRAGTLNLQNLEVSGALSLAERASAVDLLIPVFFCLGAALFYYMLYKSRLLPRFISVWGIVAVIMVFAMNMFTAFQPLNLDTTILIALAIPMILNEIFLGIWLIVRGFNKVSQ